MRHSLPLVSTLAFTAFVLMGCGETGGDAAPAPEVPSPLEVDLSHLGFDEGDVEHALVGIVEFSDFGCVFCARFHMNDYEELHREFIASGDVLWKYVPITIGGFSNGERAALSGQCAGVQDRFAPMRDLLFETREEWMAETDDPAGLFRSYAQQVGLEVDTFDACVQGDEAQAQLAEANQTAVDLGVRGTPTFLVEGFPVQGAPPLDAFQEALRNLIAESRAATPGG